MMISRRNDPAPAEAAPPAAETPAPPAETVETLRAQAAQLRAAAEQARTEQETTLTTAQTRAQQILADAKQRGADLWTAASQADQAAAQLEERAAQLAHVNQLAEQIPDAENRALDLAAEGDGLQEHIRGLDQRIADLADEHAETSAEKAAATARGEVEPVAVAHTRLQALTQVIETLRAQRKAAQDRLTAIGTPDSGGELQRAVLAWQRLQAELRRVRNVLDPARPEAVMDAAFREFEATLAANMDRIAEEQQEAKPPRQMPARVN